MNRTLPIRPLLSVALLVPAVLAQQTISVPNQVATIEAAIAMAADGDRILLTAASYQIPDTGLLLTKSLVIETVGDNRAVIDYPDSSSAFAPVSPALLSTKLPASLR